MGIANGYRVFETVTPATVAASPVLGPWIETSGFTKLLPFLVVANTTGTTVVTVEYGTDGATADPDFPPVVITAGAMTPPDVLGPYLRVRITQTVADATKTKLYIQARF
jgi:hypothetical protein